MRKKTSKKVVAKKIIYLRHYILMAALVIALLLATIILLFQSQQLQDLRGRTQSTLVNCNVSNEELTLDSEEQALFDKINTYRQENGKPQVKLSLSLVRATAWQSADMNTNKKLSHTDSLGRNVQTRLSNCGYPGIGGSENISSTGSTADSAFTAWKNSTEGHNENMLNDKWKVIGVSRSGNYWTFNSGTTDDTSFPSPVPSTQVPSPACLGSCLSPSPVPSSAVISQPITQTPSEEPAPSNEPSEEPPLTEPSASPTNPDERGERNNGGIISLLLEFLIRLLEFFASLFGRN